MKCLIFSKNECFRNTLTRWAEQIWKYRSAFANNYIVKLDVLDSVSLPQNDMYFVC